MNSIRKEFKFGDQLVTIETGEIARQADGAILIDMGGTSLLVSVVGKLDDQERDFFPLTVNYQEKAYAAGKIPGGFFKREGRPTEKETLICRLIDRPLRPLFPKGFKNEVQIIATLISLNPEVSPDIPALIGASAAVAISGIPFNGPIGAARIGYKDGEYLLNPSRTDVEESSLDLVVAGTDKAVLMVESEADQLSEEIMLGAVLFGHEQMQPAIQAIKELATEVGKPVWEWAAPAINEALKTTVYAEAEAAVTAAYQISEKMARQDKLKEVRSALVEKLTADESIDGAEVKALFGKLEKEVVRGSVLATGKRIDGRDLQTVRKISVRTGVLPRTHGSALFTRGETQAIVVATLGTGRDAQLIDALEGSYHDNFM
ncbi:MAG: polyribonucleotide nucleotidyltransferase, partial [Gammaproteobacteria bacterium]